MKLKIKTSNEATFTLEIQPSSLVADLKKLIESHFNGETVVADQRLIFAGKVLKDDQPVEFYNLKEDNTVHLVRGGLKKAAAPESTGTTSITPNPPVVVPSPTAANPFPPLSTFTGGPGSGALPDMSAMLNDPMMSTIMTALLSNPQMLEQMIASNPQLAAQLTPEMRAQLADPAFQQMLQSPMVRGMLSNPQMMQQMMSMGGMGGIGAGANPMANMMGQMPPPVAMNPFLQQMMGAGTNPATPQGPPEEVFAVQLQQLRDMGPAENIRALQLSGGNVEAAVEYLFSRPPSM